MSLKDSKLADESELEEILNNSSDMIEEGFRMLGNQKRTTPYGKRLDLLGVDQNGTLSVVELKVREDDNQLPQAIEYFDWLLERGLSFFRNYFPNQKIENKTPRIILVAPEFSERTVKLCKYISEDVQISLRQYFCFEVDGKKVIKLIDKPTPPVMRIEDIPTTPEKIIDYIKDDEARKCFEKAIEMLKGIDKENVRYSLLPYRINFIHKSSGLKFAELYPKRKYFIVRWKEADDWSQTDIRNMEELQTVFDAKMKDAVELVRQE